VLWFPHTYHDTAGKLLILVSNTNNTHHLRGSDRRDLTYILNKVLCVGSPQNCPMKDILEDKSE
jgi:hypothetical protein